MGRRRYANETITIALAGTQSTEVAVEAFAFGSLLFPAAMTGTKLLIEGKIGSSDWSSIVDSSGTPLEITKTVDSIARIPDAAFGCSALRFVSDAVEGAERTFALHLQS